MWLARRRLALDWAARSLHIGQKQGFHFGVGLHNGVDESSLLGSFNVNDNVKVKSSTELGKDGLKNVGFQKNKKNVDGAKTLREKQTKSIDTPSIPDLKSEELIFHNLLISEENHGKSLLDLIIHKFNLTRDHARLAFLTGLVYVNPSSNVPFLNFIKNGAKPIINPSVKAIALSEVYIALRKPKTVPSLLSSAESHSYNSRILKMVDKLRANLLFKDNNILIINKWNGLCCQPGRNVGSLHLGNPDITKLLLEPKGTIPFTSTRTNAPAPIHRLDKDTSGCLIMGNLPHIRAKLSNMMRPKWSEIENLKLIEITKDSNLHYLTSSHVKNYVVDLPKFNDVIQKEYLAIISPALPKTPIEKKTGKQMYLVIDVEMVEVTTPNNGFGQRCLFNWNPAIKTSTDNSSRGTTLYRVLDSNKNFSLVKFIPLTGKRHQIRAHSAQILGSPIVGDYKYSKTATTNIIKRMDMVSSRSLKSTGVDTDKLMLHLNNVQINDWYGPEGNISVKAPVPKYFKSLLQLYNLKNDF